MQTLYDLYLAFWIFYNFFDRVYLFFQQNQSLSLTRTYVDKIMEVFKTVKDLLVISILLITWNWKSFNICVNFSKSL